MISNAGSLPHFFPPVIMSPRDLKPDPDARCKWQQQIFLRRAARFKAMCGEISRSVVEWDNVSCVEVETGKLILHLFVHPAVRQNQFRFVQSEPEYFVFWNGFVS